jgi:hypothetical protein
MRISISGTHFIGKSTFIDDFIKVHPDYIHEIEPYYQLQEEQNIEFSEDPTLECLLEQLDYCIKRLDDFSNQPNVIFDRCPIDFVAYSMDIMKRSGINLNDSVVSERFPNIKEALENLDLIVFVPIIQEHESDYIAQEDWAYRKAIDKYFKKIYRDEIYDVFPSYNHPKIIEIWGNRQERIEKLETYLQNH